MSTDPAQDPGIVPKIHRARKAAMVQATLTTTGPAAAAVAVAAPRSGKGCGPARAVMPAAPLLESSMSLRADASRATSGTRAATAVAAPPRAPLATAAKSGASDRLNNELRPTTMAKLLALLAVSTTAFTVPSTRHALRLRTPLRAGDDAEDLLAQAAALRAEAGTLQGEVSAAAAVADPVAAKANEEGANKMKIKAALRAATESGAGPASPNVWETNNTKRPGTQRRR